NCGTQDGCTYLVGYRDCQTPPAGQEYCAGGFANCTNHTGAEPTCVPVDWSVAQGQTTTNCRNEGTAYDYITATELQVVDLSDPDSPKLVPNKITFAAPDQFVSAAYEDKDVYVTLKRKAVAPNDPRPHAKYYVKRIDLSNPSQPKVG